MRKKYLFFESEDNTMKAKNIAIIIGAVLIGVTFSNIDRISDSIKISQAEKNNVIDYYASANKGDAKWYCLYNNTNKEYTTFIDDNADGNYTQIYPVSGIYDNVNTQKNPTSEIYYLKDDDGIGQYISIINNDTYDDSEIKYQKVVYNNNVEVTVGVLNDKSAVVSQQINIIDNKKADGEAQANVAANTKEVEAVASSDEYKKYSIVDQSTGKNLNWEYKNTIDEDDKENKHKHNDTYTIKYLGFDVQEGQYVADEQTVKEGETFVVNTYAEGEIFRPNSGNVSTVGKQYTTGYYLSDDLDSAYGFQDSPNHTVDLSKYSNEEQVRLTSIQPGETMKLVDRIIDGETVVLLVRQSKENPDAMEIFGTIDKDNDKSVYLWYGMQEVN